jgi:amino-acid N-acetyltransferase
MGIKLVLVHGFRPQVTEQLAAKGHVSRFSHGMRITDPVALDAAQEAAGQLRFEIEAAFSQGLPNTPMANATVRVVSGNFLTARPVGIVDGVDFMPQRPRARVDGAAIRAPSTSARMVLLSPFGFSPTGEAFNLTMEDVATATAMALQADKLLFMTEVPGIREHPDDADSPIDTELSLAEARRLLARLPPPQLPTDIAFYLQHCVKACEGGVERSHILPFAVDGALAAGGVHARRHRHHGRRREAREPARGHRRRRRRHPAADRALRARRHAGAPRTHRDRARHRQLHRHRARRHHLRLRGALPLPREAHRRDGGTHGVAAGPGPGRRRAHAQAHRAARPALGLDSIFVLTTRTMHWFIKRGFAPVDPDWLPEARKRKYNWDRRSQVLVKKLN